MKKRSFVILFLISMLIVSGCQPKLLRLELDTYWEKMGDIYAGALEKIYDSKDYSDSEFEKDYKNALTEAKKLQKKYINKKGDKKENQELLTDLKKNNELLISTLNDLVALDSESDNATKLGEISREIADKYYGGKLSQGFQKIIDSSNEMSEEKEKKEEADKNEKVEKLKARSIGETITIKDGVDITLKNVSLTEERNQFSKSDAPYVVKIEYTVNNRSSTDYTISSIGMSVLDGKSSVMNTYPNENTVKRVPSGANSEAIQHFELINLGKIAIRFDANDMFSPAFVTELD